MLYTLTGNLLAEWTATYAGAPAWHTTHRATGVSFQVGGKGNNVARMAQRLGLDATAICFAGGDLQSTVCHWLAQQSWKTKIFPLDGETRGGWVVRATGRPETTFLGADTPLPAPRWEEALSWLRAQPPGWLAICGSIPGWSQAHATVWQPFAKEWRTRGGQIAIDCYGPPLADLSADGVDLLKVNRDEWMGANMARHCPAEMAIISNGPGEIMWHSTDGASGSLTPPTIEEVSPTGSGDVLLAAILTARTNGLNWHEALALSAAYASANAADPGVAAFVLEGLPELR